MHRDGHGCIWTEPECINDHTPSYLQWFPNSRNVVAIILLEIITEFTKGVPGFHTGFLLGGGTMCRYPPPPPPPPPPVLKLHLRPTNQKLVLTDCG